MYVQYDADVLPEQNLPDSCSTYSWKTGILDPEETAVASQRSVNTCPRQRLRTQQ
jgi:hypothetical protein